MYDFCVIGGGIVGLSTAMTLLNQHPKSKVLIVEKEKEWASHQTGHNSGVIHSGIYYKPGSYKARFAREGSKAMVEFCQKHDIQHEICGKVIVATSPEELPLLENLYDRGLQNGINVQKINDSSQLKVFEPHVEGLAAIRVLEAGIVNYKQVAETFAKIIANHGGDLRLQTKVMNINHGANGIEIETSKGTFHTRFLINCAGLQSDRMARLEQVKTGIKIVPFRGEYYELKPEKRSLVKNLIYPVPNPNFPFLGVHFTRMIDGSVEAGPNAVLSLKREGYTKSDIDLKDLAEVLTYPGFWKIASKYWKNGLEEMIRSFSKKAFVKGLQKLVPEITEKDIEPAPAGVRAQALKADGTLVDDFHIIYGQNTVHVCNAPSPAATASLQIGKAIVNGLQLEQNRKAN
ncbi:L-2-hydroxyglutarate oxidase [Fictibacillus fluitans]|uniref:L-2-hydroxyglutarate oxidase n=1 Tax=Fictibacillus fluitans TaxID=3058422 RepID=A0ABT8HQF6_9BACL|nr:L-2-hydroxyglutarate oxidase [Fictibacillus sp. NE201]MDN4522997.1 L-2-hydroxyglutarate oxidase [Fictibacillus sp. NE201]